MRERRYASSMPDSALAAPLLVLVAMSEEAAPLTARLEDPAPVEVPFPAPVAAVRGRLAGTDAVVVTTGIGVAAATAAATWGSSPSPPPSSSPAAPAAVSPPTSRWAP